MGICKNDWHKPENTVLKNHWVTVQWCIRWDVPRAGFMGCNQCSPQKPTAQKDPMLGYNTERALQWNSHILLVNLSFVNEVQWNPGVYTRDLEFIKFKNPKLLFRNKYLFFHGTSALKDWIQYFAHWLAVDLNEHFLMSITYSNLQYFGLKLC